MASLVGLLGCYMVGVRYVLELQALQRGTAESSQPEEDDTNQSVSSIEDDFVTALEHLEEEDTGDNPRRFNFKRLMALNCLWCLFIDEKMKQSSLSCIHSSLLPF